MQTFKRIKHINATCQLLAVLCLGLLVIACSHEVREVSQKRFMHMAKENEVKRITIVNGNSVEVWLKPYAAANSRYSSMFSNRKPDEPHFQLYIASEKAFRQELAQVSPRFSNIKEERRSLFGI